MAVRVATCSSTIDEVLHRHRPAGEIHQAATVCGVPRMERGFPAKLVPCVRPPRVSRSLPESDEAVELHRVDPSTNCQRARWRKPDVPTHCSQVQPRAFPGSLARSTACHVVGPGRVPWSASAWRAERARSLAALGGPCRLVRRRGDNAEIEFSPIDIDVEHLHLHQVAQPVTMAFRDVPTSVCVVASKW